MADETQETVGTTVAENTTKAETTPKPAKVSREFAWIVGLLVVIGVGILGFRGWQSLQAAPDLTFAMDFIQTNMEAKSPPHLARVGVNEQVAAFYKELGPVQSVVSHGLDQRGKSPKGDPTYITKSKVQTGKGPVDLTLKVENHEGKRSVISVLYVPES